MVDGDKIFKDLARAIKLIHIQKNYYLQPVLEKLSEYDKGIHQGRAEGLLIALDYLRKALAPLVVPEKSGGD